MEEGGRHTHFEVENRILNSTVATKGYKQNSKGKEKESNSINVTDAREKKEN